MQIKRILKENIGKEVIVFGWVMTCRKQSSITFIKCNDGSCPDGIQLVIDNALQKNLYKENINIGTSISVEGVLVESPAKGQKVEVKVTSLRIVGSTDPEEYPLSKTRIGLDKLRSMQHLRVRTGTFGSVFRIKSAISHGTHQFFMKEDYLHLDPNIITINECEGGAGVFQLTENNLSDPKNSLPLTIKTSPNNDLSIEYDWSKDHFGKPVFLTVSSQLQLEALSCALGPVYTTNKSFRSEHSSTNKHVSEFTHLEIENIFIDLDYLMDISERYIKYIASYILDNCMSDLENLNKFVSKGIIDRINIIKDTSFKRITYYQAIELLNNSELKEKPQIGDDLSSDAENWLTKYFNSPVYVISWPQKIKSFYMAQCDDSFKQDFLVESFDLLMPYKIGELIGGSMREDSYDKLMRIMDEKGIDKEKLKFYTDLRKFGTVPHGGFGLGIDRLCMLFTGMENIKDVIPFPVYHNNCNI